MQQRLSRLLGACELLARNETAALAGRDFAVLGKTQQLKAALLADLAAEANLFHASGNSRARIRLARLLESNRANAHLLAGMKADARDQRAKLRCAANQLHTLRSVYAGHGDSRRQAFSAHG